MAKKPPPAKVNPPNWLADAAKAEEKEPRDEDGLTAAQARALPFFLTERSDRIAAEKAGIARRTFYVWMREPQFRTKLAELRDQLVDQALDSLKVNVEKATERLSELMEHKSPTVSRAACNDVIEHVHRFRSLKDVYFQIDILKAAMKAHGIEWTTPIFGRPESL